MTVPYADVATIITPSGRGAIPRPLGLHSIPALTHPLDDGHGLSDGLRMELHWADAQDQFGEFWLPVFKPAISR